MRVSNSLLSVKMCTLGCSINSCMWGKWVLCWWYRSVMICAFSFPIRGSMMRGVSRMVCTVAAMCFCLVWGCCSRWYGVVGTGAVVLLSRGVICPLSSMSNMAQ